MSCGHNHPKGLPFCWQCGAALAHRRCSQGHHSPISALFCGECGELLNSSKLDMPTKPLGMCFDLREMLEQASKDEHLAITSKEVVSQDDIRKLLAKRQTRS